MKRLIAYLSVAIFSSIYVPALANTSDSTMIGISVVVKGKTPCQFSAKDENGNRDYSHVDSFDCATSSKKLLEKASNVARQATQDPDSNRVRVVMTIE
jgi:hypothetical protein